MSNHHPLPWRVIHRKRFPECHDKACPAVFDADGKLVCDMPQNVNHHGEYDAIAELTAQTIVACVNAASGTEHCPECGYTEEDCRIHGDHKLCCNYPFFLHEYLPAPTAKCFQPAVVALLSPRIAQFANTVLQILADEPDWSGDTLDAIAQAAFNLGLATTNFRHAADAESA